MKIIKLVNSRLRHKRCPRRPQTGRSRVARARQTTRREEFLNLQGIPVHRPRKRPSARPHSCARCAQARQTGAVLNVGVGWSSGRAPHGQPAIAAVGSLLETKRQGTSADSVSSRVQMSLIRRGSVMFPSEMSAVIARHIANGLHIDSRLNGLGGCRVGDRQSRGLPRFQDGITYCNYKLRRNARVQQRCSRIVACQLFKRCFRPGHGRFPCFDEVSEFGSDERRKERLSTTERSSSAKAGGASALTACHRSGCRLVAFVRSPC